MSTPGTQATADVAARIEQLRKAFGGKLAIFGHHYQHDDVIRHTDISGDSLELSRRVPGLTAEHIVFCGVYFMAESAAILANESQEVHIPDVEASCVMSDMAPEAVVEAVMQRFAGSGRRIVPLTYVNSSAAVKAVVGAHGGTVCTSANADKMLQWCLDQGDAVLFLPDKHLAFNTADKLGISHAKRHVLNIRGRGRELDLDAAAKAELLVWPGMCVIHHRFKPAHVEAARAADANALVVVHPECSPEVVGLADATGSTSFIINYVADAPEGATIYIGTEINLVDRLAKRYAGTKTIKPLCVSGCANMAKITEAKLAVLLERLAEGTAEPVRVPEDIRKPALLALERMLEVGSR